MKPKPCGCIPCPPRRISPTAKRISVGCIPTAVPSNAIHAKPLRLYRLAADQNFAVAEANLARVRKWLRRSV